MKRTYVLMAVLGFSVLGFGSASAGSFDFVAGQGSTHLSVLNVSAQEGPQGDTGHITFNFRSGDKMRVDVDCLTVHDDDRASVVGPVVRSTQPIPSGARMELEVFDGGKANPGHEFGPDVVHINWTHPPQGWQGNQPPDCEFNSNPFSNVLDGNIEVTDAA